MMVFTYLPMSIHPSVRYDEHSRYSQACQDCKDTRRLLSVAALTCTEYRACQGRQRLASFLHCRWACRYRACLPAVVYRRSVWRLRHLLTCNNWQCNTPYASSRNNNAFNNNRFSSSNNVSYKR